MRSANLRRKVFHTILSFLTVLALCLTSPSVVLADSLSDQTSALFTGSGTETDPYLITSADDWNALSNHVNNGGTDYKGKYFKLTADISVTTMLGYRTTGNVDIPFTGTFDGDGHTLNVAIKYNGPMAAPFGSVCNTVIKNLNVTGTVNGGIHSSGLVGGGNKGAITGSTLEVYNVTTSVAVNGYNGSAVSHLGGIVGHSLSARITMDNVVFTGSLNGSSAQGGFIGWGGGADDKISICVLSNCLFAGTVRSGNTFHPVGYAYNNYGRATLTNFYTIKDKNNTSNQFDYQGTGYTVLSGLTAKVTDGGATHYYDSIASAVSSANWTANSTLTLLADVTTSSTITVPSGEHTLDLNGHTLTGSGVENVIRVESGCTLTVCDSGTSGTITGGYTSSGYRYGAGVYVPGGHFILKSGTISGNRLTNGTTGGGGVEIESADAVFDMYGGTISNNQAGYGGGVYVRGATFNFYDGLITGNKALSTDGGGIHVYGGSSTLNMYGGTITSNTANSGAGIGVSGGATVNISGGTISGNSATQSGGGITNRRTNASGDMNATIAISGNPVIKDNTTSGSGNNVYLYNNMKLTVRGALSETARIGVTLSNGTGTFTSGLSGKGTAANFVADNSNYEVRLVKGEGYVGPAHTHDWTYTVNGGVITATCTGVAANVCDIADQTLTLTASSKTYDGTPVTATLTPSDGWTTANGLSTPTIVYSGNTDAGTYVAGVTVGDKTASVSFTIQPKSMDSEVSATGYNGIYNGKAYGITVAAPTDAVITFGTSADNCTLTASPTFDGAGNHVVYYKVTRKNHVTVTGSATVAILPLDVTITVVGHNATVDYNGKEHTLGGYDITADTELYDLTKDLVFSGPNSISRTNAGKASLGLASSQFTNVNPNFGTVTVTVTDGSLTVNTGDAVITTKPASAKPVYSGEALTLIQDGVVDGGVLRYALGKDSETAPEAKDFAAALPTAIDIGNYYVWYLVVSDENHNDLSPACVKVTLADKDWVTLTGTLYQSDGKTPLSNADVTLIQGNRSVDAIKTDEEGGYWFTVPTGVYNVVAATETRTATLIVSATADGKQDLSLPGGKNESELKVNTDNEALFGIAVGGMDAEAAAIRQAENLGDDTSVAVRMTVDAKTETTAKNAPSLATIRKSHNLTYIDVTMEKAIDATVTVMNTSTNVMEIAVPYDYVAKRGVTVYFTDGTVQTYKESDTHESGTIRVDKQTGMVYIYTNRFATFAIGYTPYYHVESTMDFGSYEGSVTVVLKNLADEKTYTLENVALSAIDFADVPKGEYEMTITWEDGVTQTLTATITIEGKSAPTSGTAKPTNTMTTASLPTDPKKRFGQEDDQPDHTL